MQTLRQKKGLDRNPTPLKIQYPMPYIGYFLNDNK